MFMKWKGKKICSRQSYNWKDLHVFYFQSKTKSSFWNGGGITTKKSDTIICENIHIGWSKNTLSKRLKNVWNLYVNIEQFLNFTKVIREDFTFQRTFRKKLIIKYFFYLHSNRFCSKCIYNFVAWWFKQLPSKKHVPSVWNDYKQTANQKHRTL